MITGKKIRAMATLPDLGKVVFDIPLRSGNEAFGFLAAFIANAQGEECPVRSAYRVMGMEEVSVPKPKQTRSTNV